jgi:anti-sigma regulatory factor (Ser/Thr protein kinase)
MSGQIGPSPLYSGASLPVGSDRPLSDPPANAAGLAFGLPDLGSVRALVNARARMAGMSSERVADLVLAVNELATNTVRHAGGTGLLRVWRTRTRVVCQIEDSGHIADPLAGRRVPQPELAGGVGLWTVNQLCELVEVRSSPAGTTIRVHASLDG